jgi:hypothetical protein
MQDETEQRRLYGRQAPVRLARREALHEAIAQEELALAKLEAQLAESRHRLAALRVDLAALDTDTEVHARPPLAFEAPIPQTPADKVKLFRSLFRGREDIFPTRFVSASTGKSGYAPALRTLNPLEMCELVVGQRSRYRCEPLVTMTRQLTTGTL